MWAFFLGPSGSCSKRSRGLRGRLRLTRMHSGLFGLWVSSFGGSWFGSPCGTFPLFWFSSWPRRQSFAAAGAMCPSCASQRPIHQKNQKQKKTMNHQCRKSFGKQTAVNSVLKLFVLPTLLGFNIGLCVTSVGVKSSSTNMVGVLELEI